MTKKLNIFAPEDDIQLEPPRTSLLLIRIVKRWRCREKFSSSVSRATLTLDLY